MFSNTIDKKSKIVDNQGNEIVDLTTSIFSMQAGGIRNYNTARLSQTYVMRPDKVAFMEYGSDENTEFILKYSGISNPFSLDKDDVVMVPDANQASAQMKDKEEKELTSKIDQVRNYFKFTNTDYKSDKSSYDALANKEIKSGVLDPTENNDYIVPYISEDGKAAITIKNGRMFFGEDNTNLDTNIQAVIDQTVTALADQCALNGLTLADFVRASTKNNLGK